MSHESLLASCELWKTHSLARRAHLNRGPPTPSRQGQRPRSSQLALAGWLADSGEPGVTERRRERVELPRDFSATLRSLPTARAVHRVIPGSTLGDTLQPVPRADGTTDLYITQDRFHAQFCADVPASDAALMAETQRPVTQEALAEPSGDQPLWRDVPSWFVFGEEDRNIPTAVQQFMAERAGARDAVAVPGASHAIAVSQPDVVAQVILQAAELRTAV